MAFLRRAPHRYRSSLIALATVGAALALAPKAPALQYYWRGGAHDLWTDANWDGWIDGHYFGSNSSYSDDIYFGSRGYYDDNGVVKKDDALTVGTLNFSQQNWNLTLAGVSLLNGGINVNSTSAQVDIHLTYGLSWGFGFDPGSGNMNVDGGSVLNLYGTVYGGGSLNKYGGGTLNIVSPVNQQRGSVINGTNLYGGTLITDNPINDYNIRSGTLLGFSVDSGYAGDLDFRSQIYGEGSFVKRGDATLTFSGNVYYTGATRVEGGRLITSSPYSSSHYDIDSGGALEFRTATAGTYANFIGGSGSFTKSGAGTLTLGSTSSNARGGVFVTEGRLIDKGTIGSNSGYAVSGGATLEMSSNNLQVVAGAITGDGELIKSGTGTLFLIGKDTYSGGTTVQAGRLITTAPHGDYFNNAALEFVTTTDTVYDGILAGSGSFTKSGDATLTLTRDYTPGVTGGTSVTGGRLIDQSPDGDYTLSNGADLEFNIARDVVFYQQDQFGSYPSRISGTGDFIKSGVGALTLLVPSSYSGDTTVTGGAIVANGANFLPSRTDLSVASGARFDSNGSQTLNSLSGAGAVSMAGGTLTINGPLDRTFSGVISGGALVKDGTGTFTLTGANSYSGGTTVKGGRLIDLNPHGTYVTNADLEFRNAGDLTYAPAITGTGNFTKSGAGTLTLTGNNAYRGTTIVAEGTLRNGGGFGISNNAKLAIAAGATFDENGQGQFVRGLSGAGNLKLGSGGYLYYDPYQETDVFDGVISGLGSLSVIRGTLTLNGQNTYSGGTNVLSGLIVARPNGDYNVSGSLTARTDVGQTYTGAITGTGSFTKTGAGTLTLSGANAYSGGTTVSQGRLIDQSPHGDYAVSSSGALEFQTTGTSTYAGAVAGDGSLTKSGAGTLTLSGANLYTGGTTVNAGRLIDLAPHGDYVTNATLEFANGADSTYRGAIDGTGTFVKSGAGTLTFEGSIKPNVTTQIAGGTLKANGGIIDGNVVGAAGTTLQLTGGTYRNSFSGAGALLLAGRSIVTLTNAPTNTGGVRVSQGGILVVNGAGAFDGGLAVDTDSTLLNRAAGALTIGGTSVNQGFVETRSGSKTVFTGPVSGGGDFTGVGTVEFDGGYSPGDSPDSVSFGGDLRLGAGNDLTMELGGAALGAGYDHLGVAGRLDFGGRLNVASIDGFSASLGQSFDLFDFSSSNGSFSAINLPTLSGGLRWDASRLYLDGSIQAVPEPGSLVALGIGGLALLRRRKRA